MNIYLIKLENVDYDEYVGFVCIAENIEKAKLVCGIMKEKKEYSNLYEANIESITLIGESNEEFNKEQIILDSFNAG